MKVLKISGKNLNSLKGVWSIDLTSSEYETDGIFSITGATGAGKSTILDALSLALFGRTPRLKTISSSTNEIMSRQTGLCSAEAEIATAKGQFRFSWSQNKARSRSDGALQSQHHEVAKLPSEEILASKIKEVAGKVVEITGLTYDQFSRSILLAQGDFAAFLKAGINERSEILEQITGTEIYSEISIKAFEKQKQEAGKLELLEAETRGIQLLEEEELKKLNEDIKVKEKENIVLRKRETNYSKGIDLLKDIKKKEEDLKKIDELLPKKKKSVESKTILKNKSEEELKLAKKEQEKHQPLFKQVRSLDQSISEKEKNTKALCEDLDKKEKLLGTKTEDRKKEAIVKENLEKSLKTHEDYILNNPSDANLEANLSGLNAEFKRYSEYKADSQIKEKATQKLEKDFEQKQKKILKFNEETKERSKSKDLINGKIDEFKKASKEILAGQTIEHYREKKEGLLREVGMIKNIQALEQERNKLRDGQPCPLCGSKEHPFALGSVPELDETEKKIEETGKIILSFENTEKLIKEQEKKLLEIENKLKERDSDLKVLVEQKTNLSASIEKSKQEIKDVLGKIKVTIDELINKFKVFEITNVQEPDLQKHLATLKSRCEKWKKTLGEKEKAAKDLAVISSKLSGLSLEISLVTKTVEELKKKLEKERTDLKNTLEKRKELFGTKNVDEEEDKLKTVVRKLEKDLREISSELEEATKSLNKDKDQKEVLIKINNESKDELEKIKQALLPETYPDKNSIEILSERLEKIRIELAEIGELLGATKEKLEANKEAQKKLAGILKNIERQQKEFQKWRTLNSLIGSADGKKFRTFAQGLTFEIMVSHANIKLSEMTDRYFLKRDPKSPLELNIIDNYKAGDIRSTKNLSGGESFIVSLALALGLSSLSSKNMKIDSLFLDEGFGTLDEETLEIALNILAGLHQTGKVIGVISHVAALKERIATQISVVKTRDGNSLIEGPGVIFKS